MAISFKGAHFPQDIQQVPRSPRRNELPVKLIDRALLMGHQHLTGTLRELAQVGKTASGPDGVLHHPPETFERVEVMPAMGGEEMEAKLLVVVGAGHVARVCPVDPTAIDDHHNLCAERAERRHDLRPIVAELLSVTVGHNVIQDFGGPILDRPHDTAQHPTGQAAPGTRAPPRLACACFFPLALALAQRTYGEARALRGAPPARAGQGKAPEAGGVCIEPNALATARWGLEGGECKRAVGESSRGGSKTTGRAVGASVLFF